MLHKICKEDALNQKEHLQMQVCKSFKKKKKDISVVFPFSLTDKKISHCRNQKIVAADDAETNCYTVRKAKDA